MLTKSDLNDIRNIVHQEVETVVDRQLYQKLEPIKKDIKDLKTDIKYLKTKVNKMDKTLNLVAKNYDEGDVRLSKRIDKLEQKRSLSDKN